MKTRKRTAKNVIYVAVVATKGETAISASAIAVKVPTRSGRERGDWSCFVGDDRDEVIRRAMEANRAWGGKYSIFVGTLTDLVVEPARFELLPITE